MCDAPLGHVQTDIPSTMKDYDSIIRPSSYEEDGNVSLDGIIEIQYGTGVKKVEASGQEDSIPEISVSTTTIRHVSNLRKS